MMQRWNRWVRFWSHEEHPISLAAVRVFLGLVLLFDFLQMAQLGVVTLLFAPEEAGVDHLKALALIARTMRDEEICTKLRSTTDLTTLHAILTDAPIRDSKAA